MTEELIARGRGSESRQSIGVSGARRGAWISPIVGVAVSCCVAISTARAQSVTREEFNDRVNEAINGVTIFTSQDSASSGVFSPDSDAPGEGDRDIDILKLPVAYTYGEEGDTLRPQVRAVVGKLSLLVFT